MDGWLPSGAVTRSDLRPTAGRLLVAALAVTLALAAMGCGADEDEAPVVSVIDPLSTTLAAPVLDGPRPPVDAIHVEPLFADEFAAAGVRLTNRGGLIDRRDGGYVKSVEGRHYALYVEPVGDRTPEEYVYGLVDLTRVVAPELFERYPELESFDICQEPTADDDDRPEPPATTQVELTRAQVEATDWEQFDLATLFALRDAGATVVVATSLRRQPQLEAYFPTT